MAQCPPAFQLCPCLLSPGLKLWLVQMSSSWNCLPIFPELILPAVLELQFSLHWESVQDYECSSCWVPCMSLCTLLGLISPVLRTAPDTQEVFG
jgi:hypothetical protein